VIETAVLVQLRHIRLQRASVLLGGGFAGYFSLLT
jgi:hypothetical protein